MPSRWKSLLQSAKHLAHHAFVAAVLALSILALEHQGWLNWVDSISLRVALAVKDVHSAALQESARAHAGSAALPQVVTIDEVAFETQFAQESPLSRHRLRGEIAALSALKPTALVIDLDLSPGPAGSASLDGQSELDALLLELAAKGETRLILATPFAVASDNLLAAKFEWMQRLCGGGVRFGYPDIQLSQGVALRFSPDVANLAAVAHIASLGQDHRRSVAARDDPCGLVGKGPTKAVFLSTAFAPELQFGAERFREQLPIDSDALRGIATGRRTLQAMSAPAGSDTSRSVIFLGSSFDARDSFLTIYGPQPGVVLHAAAYSTLQSPPAPITHKLAFMFDVLLGIAAGALFGWSWKRYNAAAASLQTGVPPLFRRYVAARLWLLLNLAVLLGWLFLLFSWSAVLLRLHLWSNPGAMVIGVFIKNLLASRSSMGSTASLAKAAGHRPSSRISFWDLALISPFVIYGTWLLLFSH